MMHIRKWNQRLNSSCRYEHPLCFGLQPLFPFVYSLRIAAGSWWSSFTLGYEPLVIEPYEGGSIRSFFGRKEFRSLCLLSLCFEYEIEIRVENKRFDFWQISINLVNCRRSASSVLLTNRHNFTRSIQYELKLSPMPS